MRFAGNTFVWNKIGFTWEYAQPGNIDYEDTVCEQIRAYIIQLGPHANFPEHTYTHIHTHTGTRPPTHARVQINTK